MRKFLKKIQAGDNKLTFKQTSKGQWYTDTLDLYCVDLEDGVKHAGVIITAINKMLFQKNKDVKDKESKKEVKKKGMKKEKSTPSSTLPIGR